MYTPPISPLLVVFSSKNSSDPEVVGALEGDTVNLTCSLGHPMTSGDLEVKWIPPQSSGFSLKSPHPVHLSIPYVRVWDSGEWTCSLIKNNTVLTSATVTLKIGEKRERLRKK